MDSHIIKCRIGKALLILIALTFTPINSTADDNPHTDAAAYVLSKFKSHDIVFLGTRHQQPRIEAFLSSLIPLLQSAGVTHVCLEIPSDQQAALDSNLAEIQLWPQIDSTEYRGFLEVIKNNTSLTPVAIDLPEAKFNQGISRDEYMARMIAPNTKILVILGNRHVLKNLEWEDHAPSQGKTIYQDLSERYPEIRMFSIVQVIGNNPIECDFTKAYAGIDGIVAMDCTEQFNGWKLGLLSVIAIKPTAVCDVLDGLLVY